MKKTVKLLGAAVVFLVVCCTVWMQVERQEGEKQWQAKGDWSLLEQIGTAAVTLNGRVESRDYPYGYNLGSIEDDEVGKAVLLTAGTSVEIDGRLTGGGELKFDCEIHPWVAEQSDGALLIIVLASGGQRQDFVYEVGSGRQAQTISLEQFPDSEIHVEISVTNEEGKNEDCDWVVFRQFTFAGGKFEGKRIWLSGEEGYVRSATYFADEWPLNFWNSEMDSLEEDMKQIREDGFDSIILVIPWREFQTEMNPASYSAYAFDRLDEVVDAAGQEGLGVYTRIGYASDFYDGIEEDESSRNLRLMGEIAVQEAWYGYVEKMYRTLSNHENFLGAFLTWEDFWNNLAICDISDEGERLEWAGYVGYQQWVEGHFTLEEYNGSFGTEYTSYSEVPVPQRTEPAMEVMYALYDSFLNHLLEKSQEKFPDLSMEVRTDLEPIYRLDGTMGYYKHTNTFSCMNASYVTMMYGIPMGFANQGELVSSQEALEKTEYILQNLKAQNGGKPVYIDQFIFADNTPIFSDNAQIKEDEMNDYLEKVPEVLLRNSEGYGIWAYRDYRANLLYNSQFVLEGKGWDTEGGVRYGKVKGSSACTLEAGGKICQEVPLVRNHYGGTSFTFEADIVDVEAPGTLRVQVGEADISVEVTDLGRLSLVFEDTGSLDIMLEAIDGDVSLDNLRLYSYIQLGYLYDVENRELQCLEGIRGMNRQLGQK